MFPKSRRPLFRGSNPRRIISAFTGPGGHATDQPSTNPLNRIDMLGMTKDEGMSKLA
jgi:hypothetical protein